MRNIVIFALLFFFFAERFLTSYYRGSLSNGILQNKMFTKIPTEALSNLLISDLPSYLPYTHHTISESPGPELAGKIEKTLLRPLSYSKKHTYIFFGQKVGNVLLMLFRARDIVNTV